MGRDCHCYLWWIVSSTTIEGDLSKETSVRHHRIEYQWNMTATENQLRIFQSSKPRIRFNVRDDINLATS